MSLSEFTNTSNENSFDPTPKLKSSPIKILFISFNHLQNECNHCGNKYSVTVLFNQKYCKTCLLKYIENTRDIYLDVCMTNDTQYNKHEMSRNGNFCMQNIQEIFDNRSEILYFKQIFSYLLHFEKQNVKEGKNCKLCGKLFPKQSCSFKICSDCYQVSCGWVKSIVDKKFIPILHLPWWDNCSFCIVCKLDLEFISDCHKRCSNCFATYTGCRYCLTTNIIFGDTVQSQCAKCNEVLFTTITNIYNRNVDIERFLASTRTELNWRTFNAFINLHSFETYNIFSRYKIDYDRYKTPIKWIPYSRITNLEKIAEGGFSIIYKARWRHFNRVEESYKRTVAIKRFLNSRDMDKYFLNEVNIVYKDIF
jgi:hypothetical protein